MRSLSMLIIALCLTACTDDTRRAVYPQNRDPVIKLMRGHYEPQNISVLCIDGIKYIVTDEGGISPKYQAWSDADPSVEECE